MMTLSVGLVLTSTLSCALVTGFVFTYAVIVMPGLAKLTDKEFIRAFQVTDELIQNNQPIFMIVWVGSVISVISTLIVSLMGPYSVETVLVIIAGFVYLLGVQGLTVLVHLPLNRRIQTVNAEEWDASALREERLSFETRWIRFNWIRTLIGLGVIVTFMVALSLKSS
ncbi:MAG: hypothetical protein CL391_03395 [Acidiferrobacteraceae bacterium]|nr:hypothetical protein [Acidiferrobacteraceae bacterium]|tara:strand:+ start:1577 stop:2080 length:504 start_codon:yes stop_codon:yes gene_type:complete